MTSTEDPAAAAAASVQWRERLRTFHLTGQGLDEPGAGPLQPLGLDGLAAPTAFPAYLSTEPAIRPLAEVIDECLRKEPAAFPTLTAQAGLIVEAFRKAATDPAGTPIGAIADATLAALQAAEGAIPQAEIARLGKILPRHGTLFPCDGASLVPLYGAILAAPRRAARTQWLARATAARNRLRDLLAVDESHGPGAASAEKLESTLGVEGDQFFDSGALAKALGHAKGLRRMAADRRARIEGALALLDEAVRGAAAQPAAYVFHSGAAPAGARALGWECRASEDSFAAALEFSRQLLAGAADVWRAARLAQIEAESAYDEAVHGERLRRFTWHAATPEEVLALPPVIVLEPAARVAESSFTGFGRLLRSGHPVQVLIVCAGIAPQLPDLGYLAMAHREAFVASTSLARLGVLNQRLQEMTASLLPAVAVVAAPLPGEGWREASAAAWSGAHPHYRYDPDRGDSWRDRFSLDSGAAGGITPAHAAALSAALRGHFRLIPADAGEDGLMELGAYLRAFEKQPPLAIPFLEVAADGGAKRRAALTRELAVFCREQRSAWRGLEELAGIDNPHVTAAVAAVREQMQAEAVAREQAARESAGKQAAAATVGRLVEVLLSREPVAAQLAGAAPAPAATAATPAASVSAPAPARTAPPSAAAPPQAAAPAAAAAEGPSGDPYIESELCTSCNDCFKVNQRLFAYNADKQAYIADASAGTYAELVKAAEGCPAKCIHPGAPRPGDPSATPALIARAAKLA